MKFDIAALERALAEMKSQLGDGIIATGIWDRQTEEVYAAINPQPTAITMFNALTDSIIAALDNSKFPNLNRYYWVDLENDHVAVVVRHGRDVMQGMLLDLSKSSIGVLMNVVIPRMLKQVEDARLD